MTQTCENRIPIESFPIEGWARQAKARADFACPVSADSAVERFWRSPLVASRATQAPQRIGQSSAALPGGPRCELA